MATNAENELRIEMIQDRVGSLESRMNALAGVNSRTERLVGDILECRSELNELNDVVIGPCAESEKRSHRHRINQLEEREAERQCYDKKVRRLMQFALAGLLSAAGTFFWNKAVDLLRWREVRPQTIQAQPIQGD